MIDQYVWLLCLSDLLNVLIVFLFISVQFKKRKAKLVWFFVWGGFYFLSVLVAHLVVSIPLFTLFVSIIFIFALTTLFEGPLQKKILRTFYSYIFMLLSEGASIVLTQPLLARLSYFQYTVVKLILMKLLLLLILRIYSRNKSTKNLGLVDKTAGVKLFLVPILSFIVTSIFTFGIDERVGEAFITITSLVVINILVFSLYDELAVYFSEKVRLHSINEQMRFYEKQVGSVVEYQKKVVLLHHDMRNHLLTLKTYIEKDSKEAALQYVNELGAIELSAGSFSHTGIIELDSMVNYKFALAEDKGIQVGFSASIPTEISIAACDITSILGNIIDNAIEAQAEIIDGEKFIDLSLAFSQANLTIVMKNSYSGERKIKEGKYITTKKDSLHHGYGLEAIQIILDNYNGLLKCEHDSNTFTTKVIMFET